jgi:hypothetical protein
MNEEKVSSGDLLDRLRRLSQLSKEQRESEPKLVEKLPEEKPDLDLAMQEVATAEPEVSEPEVDAMALAPEIRRTLVSLLRVGVVLASQKPKLFETLCRHQGVIGIHLANMYLRLLLDEPSGVAIVLQQDVEEDDETETISLINRRTLSLYDTLLLLVLRKHYQERERAGEQRVIIDVERIESHLTPFLPLTNNSKAERKKLNSALDKMVERYILSAIRGESERYEITPVIRYVVNADYLEKMLEEYERLAQSAETSPADREEADDGEE